MKFRLHPALVVAVVLALCAGIILGLVFLRERNLNAAGDLLSYLPAEQGVILAVDLAALRDTGLLDALAGSGVAREAEYLAFVQETGFDFQEDLDYALVWFGKGTTCALLKGRFDWTKLKAYAARQQGACRNSFCRVAGATEDRKISFFPLTSRIMGLAVGPDEWAATALMTKKPARSAAGIPKHAVWLTAPAATFAGNESLPAGSRLFTKAIQGADVVTFYLTANSGKMTIELDAACRSSADASALAFQLTGITRVLKEMIAREGKTPNPADLSGMLAGGVFNQAGQRVLGRWPVERELLESILGVSQ